MPTALITGITGQDGTYLAEFLLQQGYRVIGTTRDPRRRTRGRIARSLAGIELVVGDDQLRVESGAGHASDREKPDEVYHLGAPISSQRRGSDPARASARTSRSRPVSCWKPRSRSCPHARIFAPARARCSRRRRRRRTNRRRLGPRSPYGEGKAPRDCISWSAAIASGLYAVTGILFNHESPRRGAGLRHPEDHARRRAHRAGSTRITVRSAISTSVATGDLPATTCDAMWRMLFQDEPDDYVIGTGRRPLGREFCDVAFRRVGLNWNEHVSVDPSLLRHADAPLRLANPARAKARLRWTPEVDFERWSR